MSLAFVASLAAGESSSKREMTLYFDSLAPLSVHSLCPGHFHLGDVGGDSRRDLILHRQCAAGYAIRSTDSPFTALRLTVAAEWRGTHTLTTSRGGRLELDGAPAGSTIEFPDLPAWHEITELRWSTTGIGAIDSVVISRQAADDDDSQAATDADRETTSHEAPQDSPGDERAPAPESTTVIGVTDDRPPHLTARLVPTPVAHGWDESLAGSRFEIVCDVTDDHDPSPAAMVSVRSEIRCRNRDGSFGAIVRIEEMYCGELLTLVPDQEPAERRSLPACGSPIDLETTTTTSLTTETRIEVTAVDRSGNRSTVALELPAPGEIDRLGRY